MPAEFVSTLCCGFPPIYWAEFTWDAFSTLFTGLAAVAAAYYLGKKQIQISAEQIKLSQKQIALSSETLKAELFDRRMEVYEASLDYLACILFDDFNDRVLIEPKFRRFISNSHMSEFLFDKDVANGLDEVSKKGMRYRSSVRKVHTLGEGSEERKMAENEMKELSTWCSNRMSNIHELFGDKLRLGSQLAK